MTVPAVPCLAGISVPGRPATADVRDFARDLGIHPDSSSAYVLDGQ
jgi:hypothetical protein